MSANKPATQFLTKLEQQLTDKAAAIMQSNLSLKSLNASLQKELTSTKKELDQVRTELNHTRSLLPTPPQFPAGFKASPAIQTAVTTARATLSAAEQALKAEADQYQATILQDIAERNAKASAELHYKNTVEHGSYSEAVRAIARKQAEVQQYGVTVSTGISGHEFRALKDGSHLFTFEKISDATLEIDRQSYRILSAKCSDIGAGNIYQVEPIRSTHSTR